ncbi:MAG: FAD-dependent monooxygenase [Maricaulaceae bacterium]
MSQSLHVLIVGGGIGGLSAAIILAQNGCTVDVFEQASAFTEIGAGLQLSPNAMQVHAAIGTAAAISEAGFTPDFAALRDFKTGKTYLRTPLQGLCPNRYGHPYIHIHRADLQSLLVQAAKDAGVTFHLGCTAQTIGQSNSAVSVETNIGRFTGDVLIGADGIRSVVREHIHGDMAPRFTGQIAWRGTVAAHDLPSDMLPPAANVWMGPNRHFVAYYLRGGALINFVAVEEQGQWTEESWSHKGQKSDLLAAFEGWDSRVTHLIKAASDCYLWGLFDHAPLPHWTQGRVALIGDAAHPMLPFMAQGAAMATEDAWVLAQKLLTTSNPTEALKSYQLARKARATKLQAISRGNAKLFHDASKLGCAVRNLKLATASKLPALQHIKLDPIYGINVVKDFPI